MKPMPADRAAAYCLYLQTVATLQGEQEGGEATALLDELLQRVSEQPAAWIQDYVAHSERLRRMPLHELIDVLPGLIGLAPGASEPT